MPVSAAVAGAAPAREAVSGAAQGVSAADAAAGSAAVKRQVALVNRYFTGSAGVSAATVDATARAIKKSFDTNGLTVVRSRSTVAHTRVTRSGGRLSATSDVTYDWRLKDAKGVVTESSVTDTYRFRVGSGSNRGAILPPPSSGEGVSLPAGAQPASTDRSAASTAVVPKGSRVRVTRGSGRVVAAAPPMGYLNYTNMVNYALLWTDSSHENQMNPAYPTFGNNCANFVSQSLHAGGWAYRNGLVPSTLTNWSPNLSGPAGSSYTWGGAKFLGTFVWNTGQLPYLDNIWTANFADIYFMDWDPNGRADGQIDHTALVSGRNTAGPLVTQKSNNRHNVPLATYISIAQSQGKSNIVWYGART